jgi:hypothetical protein
MDGEDSKNMAWDMLDDENLPFSERVRAYTMPDKFKMPRVEKYDGRWRSKGSSGSFQESTLSCMVLQMRLHAEPSH